MPKQSGAHDMIDDSWYCRPEGIADRTSAGGIVVRRSADGQILIALVRERPWRMCILPKGGVEPGESYEQAAHREIAEEAGLTELTLLQALGTRERLGYTKRSWITTHYFLFTTQQIEGFPTDTSHHYELCWAPLEALPAMLWPEQRELLLGNALLIRTLLEAHAL